MKLESNFSRPVQWCYYIKEQYRAEFEAVYSVLDARANDPDFDDKTMVDGVLWPLWCFMPFPLATLAVDQLAGRKIKTNEEYTNFINAFAVMAWSLGKGVYRFDPTTFDYIVNSTKAEDVLPVQVLEHLPEWCVYVETSVDGEPLEFPDDSDVFYVHGFFAQLQPEQIAPNGDQVFQHCLLITLDATSKGEDFLTPVPINLKEGASLLGIMESYLKSDEMPADKLEEIAHRMAAPIVSLVTYLCCANRDLQNRKRDKPMYPEPVYLKKRGNNTFIPASSEVVWETGYRVGAAIRGALAMQKEGGGQGAGGSNKKAAHIRRAHWNTYLTGEGIRKNPERAVRIVKWIPPGLVNADNWDAVDPVLHKVK